MPTFRSVLQAAVFGGLAGSLHAAELPSAPAAENAQAATASNAVSAASAPARPRRAFESEGRDRLAERGISLRAHYIAESAWNFSGGLREGTRYAHQIDFGADFDLGKLWGWTGSKFHLTLGDRKGRNLSADRIGNFFQVQEIYGVGQNFRLYEMSYEYATANNGFNLKAGWMAPGADFAASPLYCNFQTLAFCGHATAFAQNSGWVNAPSGRWGFRINVENPLFYGRVGLFNVNPTYATHRHGFKVDLSGTTGLITLAEAGYTPGRTTGIRPGNYKIGGYRDNSNADDRFFDILGGSRALSGLPAERARHRWGWYVLGDQMLFQNPDDLKRGLSVFGSYIVGDAATARFSEYFQLALVWHGPFASRPRDSIALGTARAVINPQFRNYQRDLATIRPSTAVQFWEQAYELNYGIQVNDWLHVRPNLQFMHRPGGLKNADDVWVLGLKIYTNL